MTPAEQARAEVEAWCKQWGGDGTSMCWQNLITRLTPVFERAQYADDGRGWMDWRDRAERAEADLTKRKERPDPMWECPIPEHGQCAELCFACCLDLVRESIEESDTARKAAEAKQHATRDELNQRDGTIIDLRAALEIAEAEAEMWKCHTCGKAEADVACLRTALQVATDYNGVAGKERDGMAQRVLALEGDVARLKEGFDEVCKDRNRIRQDVARLREALTTIREASVDAWSKDYAQRALAATEPKR